MEELIKLIDRLLPSSTQSKIKSALLGICVYKPVRDKLLEEEKLDAIKLVTNNTTSRKDASRWSFRTDDILGPIAPVMKYYLIVSIMGHIVNIFTASTLIYYDLNRKEESEEITQDIPAILCHTPRFLVHPILGPRYMAYLGCTFSLVVLMWRASLMLYQRRLKLDTFTFLLFPDEVVQANSQPHQALKSYIRQHRLNLAQRVMFYKVQTESHNTVALGLRPNRTPEAREQLVSLVHKSFQLCTISFLLVLSFFIPLILWSGFTDLDFFYPNCHSASNSLLASANRTLSSIALSIIIMFDCVGVDLYAIFLDNILTFDLKLYWTRIEMELMEMNRLMREHRYLYGEFPIAEVSSERGQYSLRHRRLINSLAVLEEDFQFLSHAQRKKRKQQMSVQVSKIGELSYLTDSYSSFELRERIYVFQTVMCDFFVKLGETDEYMSLALGMTFFIWVVVNGVISYIGLELNTSSTSVLIRFTQFFMLLIFCVLSAIVLNLKHSIDPAYKIINSIMANDQSLEKGRWLGLLDYYTGIPRNSFTIFHSGVFTLLIFFQSFSYTLTFAIYMFSLRAQTPQELVM